MVDSVLSSHAAIIGIPILAVNRHTDSKYRHAHRVTLGERIRHARKLRGHTQTALAKMAGIEQPSLSELETGETKEPMASTLISLSVALRVRHQWLAHEDGSMEEEPGRPGLAHLARDAPLPATDDTRVDIPVFDVVASMGFGATVPEHDTVVDHMRLSRDWLSRNLPGNPSMRDLAVISAYGDSMTPTFSDGDILLVDRGVMSLRVDAVYVLSFHDELYIKRIQRRPDGSIAIISDNKVYEAIVVPPGEKESVRVLGRVLWAWNGKRL